MAQNRDKMIISLMLVLVAVLSIFYGGRCLSSPMVTSRNVAVIDEKIKNVMELTAVSAGASVAVSALPGDMATPLADKLADFSSYFVIILCALYLEKYLLTVTGYAVACVLVPLACGVGIYLVYRNSPKLRMALLKVLLVAFAVSAVIPVSIKISNLIDATYDNSLQSTINSANQSVVDIESNNESLGVLEYLTDTVKEKLELAQDMLTDFVEALAVMVVTSCLIPLLVIIFFWFLIKSLFGFDPMTLLQKKAEKEEE